MTTPIWFDVTAQDAPTSRKFYSSLFGWTINVDEHIDYGMISAGDGEPPVGGVGQVGDANQNPAGVVAYFPVPDVTQAVAQAEVAGGALAIAPWTLPGLGTMAVISDPDGNRIGVMSADDDGSQQRH